MRGGADHTVVESKTNAVEGREVCVDDRGTEAVGIAEGVKESVRLGGKIGARANRDQLLRGEEGKLLVVAKDGTVGARLLGTKEGKNAVG